jgi:nucleotide-binding universal stress UspA family protein
VQGDPGPLLVDIANKEQADILVLGASRAEKATAAARGSHLWHMLHARQMWQNT